MFFSQSRQYIVLPMWMLWTCMSSTLLAWNFFSLKEHLYFLIFLWKYFMWLYKSLYSLWQILHIKESLTWIFLTWFFVAFQVTNLCSQRLHLVTLFWQCYLRMCDLNLSTEKVLLHSWHSTFSPWLERMCLFICPTSLPHIRLLIIP